MTRKSLLVLIIIVSCVVSSLAVFAHQQKQKQQSKDDQAIKAVIRRTWSIKSEQDLRQQIAFPYLSISVRSGGAKSLVFRDKADLEKLLKKVRGENERLAKEPATMGGPTRIIPIEPPKPQLSQVVITKPSADLAYVSYNLTFKPNPSKKPPIPLLTVLRKEQNSWKITVNILP